jgi:hypothetical protein
MLLVLTTLDDLPALSFVRASAATGSACAVVTSESLSFARRRSHRVSDAGTSVALELADGTTVDGNGLTGVLNRLMGPPDLAWHRAGGRERDYATAELHAFTLSWLSALPCPVRNRPTPSCLTGPTPHPFLAVSAAAEAGLACAPVRMGTGAGADPAQAVSAAAFGAAGPDSYHCQVVCLDGHDVTDASPPWVRDALPKLAALLGLEESLVGVDFVVGGGQWWFAGTTPMPDLRLGGAELYGRLHALLGPALTAVAG